MVPNPIELRAEHTNMLTLQAIPSHATIPAARAGRTFQRMPSQSAHRHRRGLGPPTGADRTARRQPRDPHTGASSALVPVPPRPPCRYPLDPHTDKVISPGMKHSHPRERTLDEGPHPIPHNKRGGEHGQTHRHQRRYRALSRHRLSPRIHLSAQPGRRGRRHARCLRQAHTFLP